MLTKPTDGVLELPHGQPDHVEAIVDLLAGSSRKERREVREAVRELVKLDSLQVKTDLNAVAVANFSRYNPPPSGRERTKAYRERERLRALGGGGDVTPVTGSNALEESRVEEKRGEETPPNPPPKRKRKTPLHNMPDGWEPSDACIKSATAKGLNIDGEVVKFKDWTTAKGRQFSDWQAGFRSHLSSEADRNERAGRVPVAQREIWTPETSKAWRKKAGLS